METVVVVLLTLNLLCVIAVLLLLALRRGGAGAVSDPAQSAAALAEVRAQVVQSVREESQQNAQLLRADLASQRQELGQSLLSASQAQTAELARERDARGATSALLRDELRAGLTGTQRSLDAQLDQLRSTLSAEFESLRQGNDVKLEQMRQTVDEKLQGTLEKRLGESFSLVSDRLEQVQKGLGEMQSLASDVGGLKRVLTNVKSRGGWGEVQLARQLEDVLTLDQYAHNVAVVPGSSERVEFAVRLPGAGVTELPVWLPIDSKFPQEDYERLLAAQESGDPAAVEVAGKDIERAVLAQAKLIASKYVHPPHTTDFGVMYLPTEGLFAEVMRRPGFVTKLQNEHRIAVTGPTTLMALLNSLQMGFRTLAIEQRSSEVWKVLSAAKAEFEKYGEVWDKVGKQLETVQNTVASVKTRTNVLKKALRNVESLEPGESAQGIFDGVLPAREIEDVAEERSAASN